MAYMKDCIFCNIINGSMPAFKIYEDDSFIAFLDIFPRVKGHALVVPKKHYRWVYDVPEFGEYWEVARTVGTTIQTIVEAKFTSFVTVGEEVHHAHIHILPQNEKGPSGIVFEPVVQMSKEDIQQLSDQIRKQTRT